MVLRQWLDGSIRRCVAGLVVAVVCLGAVPAQAGTTYDAAADFSATDNPNGAWSYGWSQTLGSDFNPIATPAMFGDLDAWPSNIHLPGTPNPAVVHNGTGDTIIFVRTIQYLPGQLGFHPGPYGEYAIVRWTAPSDGYIATHAVFVGLDFVGPTTTDVHVLYNGLAIFDGKVAGFGKGAGRAMIPT
jgi:hypothetical protein